MPVTSPPPLTPPGTSSGLANLTGTVQVRRPNSGAPFNVPYSNVTRYADLFDAAGNEFDMDPFFMAAMALIESDANQTWPGTTTVILRDDGFGDGNSVGILQVKPKIWQSLVPDADPFSAAGNIRLGSAIMRKAIREKGESWERAIRETYFPTNDPNGTTQDAYVQTLRALVKEMRANAAAVGGSPSSASSASAFLACLTSQIGKRYVHATAGPTTFDCSGLVYFCYKQATGKEISGGRGSWLQCNQAGRQLGRTEALQPGDLLCYLDGGHVGVYEGHNTMVNALNENEGVRENDITTPYWQGNYDGARRIF